MTPSQNVHFLRQAETLCVLLGEDAYAAQDGGRSPIGAHLRHVVDYYNCFFNGLEAGRIDYDARQRDPALEVDPVHAAAVVRGLIERFEALGGDREREILVKVDTRGDEELVWSRSTLARELQFLVSHTVHHYALISLMMRHRGLEPDPGFGVAPSTLDYRKGLTAATPIPGAPACVR